MYQQQQQFSQNEPYYDWSDPQHFRANMYGELTQAQRSTLKISGPSKHRILYGVGAVTIEKHEKYKVRLSSERDLKLPDRRQLLPPGDYEFYYLDNRYTLLSALPLRTIHPQPSQQMREYIDRTVQALLDFTEQEVITNIEGKLSEKQRRKLKRLARGNVVGFAIFLLLAIGMFALGIYLSNTNVIIGVVFAAFSVLILALSVGNLTRRKQRLTSIEQNAVQAVEGIIEKERKKHQDSEGGTSYTYHFLLDGKNFQVNERAYNALDPGPRYRIYYVPGSNDFLSMEMMEPPLRSRDFPLNF